VVVLTTGPSVTVTVTGNVPDGVGVRRLTVAEPGGLPAAADVAVTLTLVGLGNVAGAVYSPVWSIVPLALPPTTAQVTDWFVELLTVAVNC